MLHVSSRRGAIAAAAAALRRRYGSTVAAALVSSLNPDRRVRPLAGREMTSIPARPWPTHTCISSVSPLVRPIDPTIRGAAFPSSCDRRHLSTTAGPTDTAPSAPTDSLSGSTPPAARPPFAKVLIANRGEIALRVIRTCRSLGISTVAIHSTIDSRAPHVLEADEAVCVGLPASSDSYLNVDAVCDAIRTTGAEAVHPGYGFLSENAEFARRVTEMGVKFVGPSPSAIVAMGDKIQSKRIAREAGVSVIPGFDGFVKDPDDAVKIAEEVGYPVMIKATSGGGGKGMRICYTPDEVREGYQLSTAEAKSFFGDERLFIERYVENPHHIEFQVLSGRSRVQKRGEGKSQPSMNPFPILDGKEGGDLEILVFPERECSIQRRNQKIIEESPSVLLTAETRASMVRQVKDLVRNVEYESAGTVEFLVDEEQNFFFLEMNTRLQVEHPVTEMVTGGLDLVRGMLYVAAGQGVPDDYLSLVTDEDDGAVVPHAGHAIEARIYAEDPLRGFLPSTGPLLQYIEPPQGKADGDDATSPEIRVDSGVRAGTPITQFYDPMISKLVAYSPLGRVAAMDALGGALDRYVIRGVGHNASFASDVLRHPDFREGRTPTNFIPTHYPDGFEGVALTDDERGEVAAIAATVGGWRMAVLDQPPLSLSAVGAEEDGGESEEVVVCLGGMFGEAYRVRVVDPGEGRVAVQRIAESKAERQEMELEFQEYDPCSPIVDILVNGIERTIQLQGEDNTGQFSLKMFGSDVNVLIMSPKEYELSRHMQEPPVLDTSNLILSPMPGTLISYAVQEGDHVEVGQEICIVEAMKMQNVLRSECAGVVAKCLPSVGSSLKADEIIVEFESVGLSETQGEAA